MVREMRGGTGYRLVALIGKTAVGVGVGACLGIGVIAAAAIAEVTIPAVLTLKALGLTCGAAGFLFGAKALKKKD